MSKLSANSIASFYTIEQIAGKITEYQGYLDSAAQGGYRLDTTQGAQSGTPPDPIAISELLETYLKAYQIKTGQSFVRLISAEYTP